MILPSNNPAGRPGAEINLAGFLPRSTVNGPGTRAVVWVRGCPFRCPGCFNEPFQPFSPATPVPVAELAGTILSAGGIDGVTFSGGEPFAQAGALAALGDRLRSAGLTIVTYTGYTPEQLAAGSDPAWPALLSVTDLLIAGPYVAGLAEADPLKGSSNQVVIPLSARIPVPGGNGPRHPAGSRTEFTISPDGSITATGFPEPAFLVRLASRCRGA